MLTVAIGIPIYNNAIRVKNLIFALLATAAGSAIHVLDDGSTNASTSDEVATFCRTFGTNYTRATQNAGVPASWNRLIASTEADVIILLNDDVLPTDDSWLDIIRSVFELNPTVGIAYWAQKRVDPASGAFIKHTGDSTWFAQGCKHPLLRSNFCGAFFAVRRSLWQSIRQPDKSIGFWADLISYGEEIDFSLECASAGMHIVQLPIFWEHLQGQTFAADGNLRFRNRTSCYLSHEEYIIFCNEFPQFAPASHTNWQNFSRKLFSPKGRGNQDFIYPRLAYSLAMIVKKWKDRDAYGMRGLDYLKRLTTDGFPGCLRQAIAIGSSGFPATIRYRAGGAEVMASLDQALSDPSLNLS